MAVVSKLQQPLADCGHLNHRQTNFITCNKISITINVQDQYILPLLKNKPINRATNSGLWGAVHLVLERIHHHWCHYAEQRCHYAFVPRLILSRLYGHSVGSLDATQLHQPNGQLCCSGRYTWHRQYLYTAQKWLMMPEDTILRNFVDGIIE